MTLGVVLGCFELTMQLNYEKVQRGGHTQLKDVFGWKLCFSLVDRGHKLKIRTKNRTKN